MFLLLQKIVWSLAPLAWGGVTGWPLQIVIPYFSFNYLLAVIGTLGVIYYFFGAALQQASQKYELQFFGYSFSVPSWRFFAVLAIVASCLRLTPLNQMDWFSSLLGGVIISAVMEELVARSFFVKYKMGIPEFLILNLLSSLAFAYMHAFYMAEGVAVFDLLKNGHLQFGFMLGIVVYKTQRIELSILLHMLSNLLRYTIPVCVFQCPYPSWAVLIGGLFVDITYALVLAGCTYKQKK